jgi:hypothetical protein
MLYTGKTATHEVYAFTFFVIVHCYGMENCYNFHTVKNVQGVFYKVQKLPNLYIKCVITTTF